jgi:SAM-dependent methyltransferase
MAAVKSSDNTAAYFSSDAAFDQLYPTAIQELAYRHWTPLEVAKKAAEYLVTKKKNKILDIGSGVGKFCLAAAQHKPAAFFYGIEQRQSLVDLANAAKEKLDIKNVSFLQGNFTKVDFSQYDHFYFYNSFYENLDGTPKIDSSLHYTGELFDYYNAYLHQQLEKMPAGTRLATFHIIEEELTQGYHIVGTDLEDSLKYWVKV